MLLKNSKALNTGLPLTERTHHSQPAMHTGRMQTIIFYYLFWFEKNLKQRFMPLNLSKIKLLICKK